MALKYFLILFSALYSLQVFSFTAVVSVLDAPVFSQPSDSSKIVSYYRKGKRIHIYSNQTLNQRFLLTILASGEKGYIQQKHLHFEDLPYEVQSQISKDSTDYRDHNPLRPNWDSETIDHKSYLNFTFYYPIIGFKNINIPSGTDLVEKSFPLNFALHFFKHKKNKARDYYLGIGLDYASQNRSLNSGANQFQQDSSKLAFQFKAGIPIYEGLKNRIIFYSGLSWHPLYQADMSSNSVNGQYKGNPFSLDFDLNYQFAPFNPHWGLSLFAKSSILLGKIDNKNLAGFADDFSPQNNLEMAIGLSISRYFP